jgi:UDP-N-acetylglucosamine--N-acetylmuramyl-(pentapeptide) pyrophosphoryl-undecaprenol N-acetylglucosamine transferase
MTEKKSIMLAAGGTGGHLFPAFALAEELQRRSYVVDLATDMRGDRYGTGFPARTVHRIPSATLKGRSPLAIARTLSQLARGTFAARRIMKDVSPAVVVGFGGYPTFPPLVAAKLARIPTILHEQNAVLGRANRMLAKRVERIATSFPATKFLDDAWAAKTHFVGNPVRDMVIAASAQAFAPPTAGEPFKVAVFGGSQGARVFSDLVPEALSNLPTELKSRLSVVQQARHEDVERVKSAYQLAGIKADIAHFFADLPDIIAASHLVVARAGASTVAELTVIGRPAILVPLPGSLDNDQLQNATQLAESGAGWCIEQKDLSPARLTQEIASLIGAPQRLVSAAQAARGLARPDAVSNLADLVEELVT